MCGVAGFLGLDLASEAARSTIEAMVARLRHRGPDDAGLFLDDEARVALGHARLSVIDLSPAGHQPMTSSCGRYVVSFNGEIYNHLELRDRLEAEFGQRSWRGLSDTETLLECVSAWGVDDALRRADAMFAFALWDRKEREVTLARDRFGEKPLYYTRIRRGFAFASVLGAFDALPGFERTIDPVALRQMLYGMAVQSPRSIFIRTVALPPGHLIRLRLGGKHADVQPQPYWHVAEAIGRGLDDPFRGTDEDAEIELEERLSASIRRRTNSDVPLGVFLSGGIDSTTVAALCQRQSASPVRTFTAAFDDVGHDEAAQAEAIAQNLGTDHVTFRVTAEDAVNVVERLHEVYAEPFSDSSQIATALICQAARQHVTVALGGDGADELFGGYNRYHSGYAAWQTIRKLPPLFRRGLAPLLRASLRLGTRPGGASMVRRARLHKFSRIMTAETVDSYYDALVFPQTSGIELLAEQEREAMSFHTPDVVRRLSGPSSMMARDIIGYLPNDILVKVDRASMAFGLEARSPYLEPDLFAFAWRLPERLKVGSSEGKILLRRFAYKLVPRQAVDRPKSGFSVPIDTWLRGRLRDWAEGVLSGPDISAGGLLDPDAVRDLWRRHQSGEPGWTELVWSALVFLSWFQHQSRGSGGLRESYKPAFREQHHDKDDH